MTAKTDTKANSPKISMVKYDKAVRSCRTAASNLLKANWTIGDAALAVEADYGQKTLQRFADDIGVNYRTVLDLRAVAGTYSDSDRSEINTWTVHQIFVRLANRAELVKSQEWTCTAARAYVKSLNDSDDLTGVGSDDLDGNDDTTPAPAMTDLDKARADVARLQGELMSAMAKLAKLEAIEAAAPKAKATAPEATAPKAKATAPKATAPKATAPKATAPKARRTVRNDATAPATVARISDTTSQAATRARHARKVA